MSFPTPQPIQQPPVIPVTQAQPVAALPTLVAGTLEISTLNELVPIIGSCCISLSMYCSQPACYGGRLKLSIICLENEYLCCKAVANENVCISLQSIELAMIYPRTCIKCIGQCFCLDLRLAIPTDEEVPCMCNILGITLFFKEKFVCHCCKNIGDMTAALPRRVL